MKSKTIFLSIAIVVATYFGITSFKSHSDSQKYEHLFIMTENHDLDGVYCSEDGKTFQKHNYDKEGQGLGDLNPIIVLIHDYEDNGWELMSAEFNGVRSGHGFWLRRLKK